MANKQIVDYIREAETEKLKKAEIIHNLKDAGWSDVEIRDAFAYINLYSGRPFGFKAVPTVDSPIAVRKNFPSLVSLVLGILWTLSGLNKILGDQFTTGFADFVRNQIDNSQAFEFYKNILNSFVLPNAALMAQFIQYSELGIGAVLVIFGIWNFFRKSNTAVFLLCLASVGSFFMILNIILSLGIPYPWVNTDNAFAQGMTIEYFVLLVSFVSALGYFNEI